MLKILKVKWNENEKLLKDKIKLMTKDDIKSLDYTDIVKLTFDVIYNANYEDKFERYNKLNVEEITEIDNGDYQGTLLYLIPFKTYQPSADEYLMTFVYYGSCSGCDTLQAIQYDYYDSEEKRHGEMLSLCRDIVVNAIKPYNYGWRYDSKFDIFEDELE